MAAIMPRARLARLAAGHLPWVDEPQRCAEILGRFLAEGPPLMSPALAISAVLFGLIAVLNLGVGLFVPFALRAADDHPGPPGLFHPRPDALLFGSEPLGDRGAPP